MTITTTRKPSITRVQTSNAVLIGVRYRDGSHVSLRFSPAGYDVAGTITARQRLVLVRFALALPGETLHQRANRIERFASQAGSVFGLVCLIHDDAQRVEV